MDRLPLYARDRNKVSPGHEAVSRLSPAIRHRLIDGVELIELALKTHRFGRIEKWIQEVCWRGYWKAWLEQRPQVWDWYDQRVFQSWSPELLDRCHRIETANSGNPIIDGFASELKETGYLHNHARMWVAAWWIHSEGLPWELGAAWFFRHLLDADPASNTLSWRWVAGLQTPGKTYLARRANLEKYLDPDWLAPRSSGLAAFESPEAILPVAVDVGRLSVLPQPRFSIGSGVPTGLWIHEEDLAPESGWSADFKPEAVLVTGHASAWQRYSFSPLRRQWLDQALSDSSNRAEQHWGLQVERSPGGDLAVELADWALRSGVRRIVTMRPMVGPLAGEFPGIFRNLESRGLELVQLDREHDVRMRPHATGGFFKFWERVRPYFADRGE